MTVQDGGNSKPTGLRVKLCYGSGQAIDAAVQAAVNTFLLFYLTAVCGLSGSAAGSIFLLSLVIDGLLDPFIGRLSDNWRSRWGRRLPFMVIALPPMALSLALMFSLPSGMTTATLFACVLLLNVVLRIALSIFMLPYSALTAELTEDYRERSVISSFRALFIVLGTAAALLPAFTIIFAGKGGLQSQSAYPWLGLWTAFLVIGFGASCLLGSGRDILRLPTPQGLSRPTDRSFFLDIAQLFRNPSFVPLFVGAVLVLVGQGAVNALNLHAYRYFWKLPDPWIHLPLLMLPVGMLIGTLAAGVLLKRAEKRDGVIGGVMAAALFPAALTLLQIIGLVPAGTLLASTLVLANGLLLGACSAILFICFYSMIADAVDEHDQLFGVRREALYAAALMLGAKAATGLGAFLAGIGLQIVGFSAGSGKGPPAISAGTAQGIGLLWGLGAAVLLCISIPFFRRYKIDRAYHSQILAKLATARRDAVPHASH